MKAPVHAPRDVAMGQHFENYFDLLLRCEREKLLNRIGSKSINTPSVLLDEVEYKIAYLRGALRMGKLLCLISTDEAKLKYALLDSEREALREKCVGVAERPCLNTADLSLRASSLLASLAKPR